ncbi:hypothetical protein [Treponema sp.]|uniref:hypothetical protein n=1 Tax=Treponema sp. TaxID=166 RepID=UPI0038901150
MKRFLAAALTAALFSVSLFAYNPPAGGQNVLRLTEPQLIYGANSSAGGAIFGVTPASIINNPALTAWEQRVTLDLAGTMLLSSNSADDKSVGTAFEGGILIPSRWCVSTFLFQGIWAEFIDMPVGDSINFTAGVSKDITDQVSVGISADYGYLFGKAGKDWTASASLGCYYDYGSLFFMKNLRFGVSMNNIGKVYTDSNTLGITDSKADAWPGLCTPRTGIAATMVSTDIMDMGLSFDLSYPAFQNIVVDAGLQLQFWDFLKVAAAWEYDAREFSNGAKNIMPSVGLSFKFTFSAKDGSYLSNKGWEQSEITVSGTWKQLYKNINAVSAGAIMNLGMTDTKAPEISLWDEE